MTRGHAEQSRPGTAGGLAWLTTVALIAAAVGLALWWATVTAPAARAEPDQGDVEAAEERLRELEARHQRAVEEFLQAETKLDGLDGDISETEARVDELRAEAESHEDGAAQMVRRLYTGREAMSATSMLDAADVAEAGRRAAYLEFAERSQRATFERYRHARVELDHQTQALRTARAEAADLREELAAEAERIDEESDEQQGELASLRERVAEREAAERAERERAAARRARAAAEQEARQAAAAEPDDEREVASRDGPQPAARSRRDADPSADESAGGSTEEPSSEAPSASQGAAAAVEAAMSKRGSPYQWGATGPNRFDCSGLTSWAWNQAGVAIPRSSRAQYSGLPRVSRSELQPGDLVFFGDPIHHVAMYIGDGQMVEAPYSGQSVRVRSMDRPDYVGAARPGG